MKKYKYALYQDDELYDYFNTLKEIDGFLYSISEDARSRYYWHTKKVIK